MRKNRSSFFNETNPSFQANMLGPVLPYPNPNNYNPYAYDINDFESKFAKIERQINRLEHRLEKLETSSNYNHDDYDNNNTNMYML